MSTESADVEHDACHLCDSELVKFDYGLQQPNEEEARRLSKSLSAQLFHEACASCQGASDAKEELCDFCQHLRLSHMLCCVDWTQRPFEDTFIRFCRLEDIGERNECSFCQLVVRSVMPYAYFSQIASSSGLEGGYLEFSVQDQSIFTRIYYSEGGWGRGRRIFYDRDTTVGLHVETQDRVDRAIRNLTINPSEPSLGGLSSRQSRRVQNGPGVGGRVNWDVLSGWLSDCFSGHSKCSGAHFSHLPPHFRVIDVRRRRIVQAGSNCRFVALSYVWGRNRDPTKLFAERSEIDNLREDGGLPALKIPATVEDAMEVCRRLKEDYLWVDRFCIVQDDIDDKREHISSMAAIYSLARFVIITTDGDSDSGIPGVSHERSQGQIQSKISGLNFTNEVAGWREITGGASIWSTRGWTYQEAILAQRKIYLTQAQSFFECGELFLSEDGSEQAAMYSPNALRPQPWNPLVDTFYSHLTTYRVRSLTVVADIYNAIDGVASALYAESNTLWYGLPRKEFDKALLWCRDWTQSERVDLDLLNDELGPSWSWSSTNRDILLLDDCNRRTIKYCDTLVMWASFCRVGQSHRLESIETTSGKPLSEHEKGQSGCDCPETLPERVLEQLLYLAVAWAEGCVNALYPFEPPSKTTFSALKSVIGDRWPCHHHYLYDTLQIPENGQNVAGFLSRISEELDNGVEGGLSLDSNVIITRAQSALFQLQGSVQKDGRLGDLCIIDEKGQPVGLLIVQDLQLENELAEDINARQKFEFIALSMSSSQSIVLPDADLEYIHESQFETMSLEHLTLQDSEKTLLFPLPVVNVMLIRRTEGLAHRVSVGWIYLTSWSKARPRFKTVCLG